MAKTVKRLSSWASLGTIIRDRRDDAAVRTAAAFRSEKFVRRCGSEDEGALLAVGLTTPSECGWTAQSSEDYPCSPSSWTVHEKAAIQTELVFPSATRTNFIAGLSPELWAQVLAYLDDHRDLFRVARVSRALRATARVALTRHTFRVETTQAVVAFSDALARTPDLAHTIHNLHIRCADSRIPPSLPLAFRKLHELRSLSLHVTDPDLALACVQRGLFNEPLPHLTVFSTSLPCTIELLDFVQTHGTIEDLTVTDDAIDPAVLGPKLPLPSLRILTCRMEFLQCFSRSTTLTHLYITMDVAGSLDELARLLGSQLVSLQLGLGEKPAGGEAWSPAEVTRRFPRLRYLQLRVLEPDLTFWRYPIDWTRPRHRNPSRTSPSSAPRAAGATGLVLAFVFDCHAPTEGDLSAKFHQTIAGLLRTWTPHVARVLYGHNGRPDTSCVVRVSRHGEEYVRERREFGEDFWKMV
ncbi:hypothetical protein DICSQDRAFT_158043 [Dichomitus squalens LYAD-421 SS1]|uniref:F-box domain-containing protein n=1 Tax=Dichomitus squalens (strain LYAD-421) TaxID=732165 RepID=R7SIT8_DICSQ|nr:uncharacterized protein DICSQDRAFT_158043 [Dichomitus squalens LYAD-421 SS1]EJF56076.1 hypothetical protein DICSQDRAFT_158043 [Dichomitus squalens LYAD-421 SS1]